jgi:hypothetical protein
MTDDDSRRQESAMTARETLRTELLTSGLSDEVPLAEVETVINRLQLTKTTAERQELALSTMRSLVADGLVQFYGWEDLPLEEAMARVTERYVDQYDDPSGWVFSVWLKLTDAGKGVATALKDKVD